MIDIHNYYVYENQRWNPVTGYTAHGLPTDRYMWSDATGRHKCTREHTKLLSMHWHWVSAKKGSLFENESKLAIQLNFLMENYSAIIFITIYSLYFLD